MPRSARRCVLVRAPIIIEGFSGQRSFAYALARLHLRLHYAVYTVVAVVVDKTPGDVLAGLGIPATVLPACAGLCARCARRGGGGVNELGRACQPCFPGSAGCAAGVSHGQHDWGCRRGAARAARRDAARWRCAAWDHSW